MVVAEAGGIHCRQSLCVPGIFQLVDLEDIRKVPIFTQPWRLGLRVPMADIAGDQQHAPPA